MHQVGPGARGAIAALQAAGCPDCGGTAFRPMALAGPGTADERGAAAAGFQIRPAPKTTWTPSRVRDRIALVSFGDKAIDDPALHRKRVPGRWASRGGHPGGRGAGAPAVPVGWAWLSGRTNSLTGARYGNFRSLATADVPGRGQVGELLMRAVLPAADQAGFVQLTGKVHASNLGMRALYRKFGFEAAHLTMESAAAGPPGRPGGGPG